MCSQNTITKGALNRLFVPQRVQNSMYFMFQEVGRNASTSQGAALKFRHFLWHTRDSLSLDAATEPRTNTSEPYL